MAKDNVTWTKLFFRGDAGRKIDLSGFWYRPWSTAFTDSSVQNEHARADKASENQADLMVGCRHAPAPIGH
jgi:hypothetical protein